MIALLAVALAFASGADANNDYTQTVLASAPLRGHGEIEIDDEYGDVRVSAGAAGVVKIQAVKRASDESDLSAIDVHVDAVEGAVKISTDFPKSWSLFHHTDRSVNYDVHVPAGTKVILHLRYGDGSVNGVAGAIDAESRYGDVDIAGAAGNAILDSEYGNVSLSESDASSTVSMHTTYGDVDLTLPASAAPQVHAVTRLGDVNNEFGQTTAGPLIDLKTTFGDVTVRRAKR